MTIEKENLKVNFAGIEFKNPFVLASGPPTKDAERIIRAAKMGWGGAVTKTIAKEPTVDARTRLGYLRRGRTLYGMNNIELITREPLKRWTEDWIPKIKEDAPKDFVLIGSIMAPSVDEEWAALATAIQDAGADMIELNISCPHGTPEKRMGAFIGQNPDLTKHATEAVKSAAKIPVIVKITPNVTDIIPIAKAAVEGGADAISGINTIESLIGIDIGTATPLPKVYGPKPSIWQSTYGGYCGPAIRPVGLRIVAQVAKAIPQIPISGIGGVETWENAVEYMMVGAKTVQICSVVMWRGYGVISKLTRGLADFLQRKGYSSIDEVVGEALPKITSWGALPKLPPIVAEVDPVRCTGCARCVVACRDGGYEAIKMDEALAVIAPDMCDGCGLCEVVCEDDAIRFKHKV
ncbi:MAG: NAD-dependent dihydropyrimidine dehydrogenase subunit PreA [Candidatus Geothermarchaeales archaeon]